MYLTMCNLDTDLHFLKKMCISTLIHNARVLPQVKRAHPLVGLYSGV